MIKLSTLILEINQNNAIITMDDVDEVLVKRRVSREVLRMLEILEEYYYSNNSENKEWVESYLSLLNKALQRAIIIAKNLNIPHVDGKYIKEYLLGQQEFHSKEEELFPFPLYVSSSPEDENTIGILVDFNGKVIEIHEGHDESSPETTNLVNKLLNPQGKLVRVYSSQNRNLVFKIDEEEMLPANLYVSPDKKHAQSHMDLQGERETFTCIIDINSVNQDSDLDWKTVAPTRIKSFKFL